MYSISGHGSMISDKVRMAAYEQALRRAVKPGSVVLDIGSGIGIFAMLACQFGARQVYAIEPDGIIQVARETAATNGFAGRIKFIQKLSTRTTLPERADVIVSDLRGILPPFQHHIPAIADARRRLLAPGGVLIPQRDTLWAAVVSVPDLYRRFSHPWDETPYGLDMKAARKRAINQWTKARVNPEQLLVEPQCWATLDYTTIENPDLTASLTWTATRPGIAHGLNLWFDATLTEGVTFSNAPGAPEALYGSAFFPWTEPVNVAAGDTISVELHADLAGEDYVWRWNTLVLDNGKPGPVKANFKQSTFFGIPISLAQLGSRDASHVPVLNEDGRIEHTILALMNEHMPLGEISRLVSEHFPMRFPTWQSALDRVSLLSKKFGM